MAGRAYSPAYPDTPTIPMDPATTTSSRLQFRETGAPINAAVTKFGGQPVWIDQPAMPLSRRTGQPMTFIAQVLVPQSWHAGLGVRMAYIFMTGAGFDDKAMETWDPNDGETAVIVQQARAGVVLADSSGVYPQTLQRWSEDEGPRRQIPCEYAVDEVPMEERAHVPQDELFESGETVFNETNEGWRGNKIGGSPYWIQAEEFPYDDWRLLLQLHDGDYPFSLNLGTGVGYVFLDGACAEGQLLWQC